MRKLQSISLTLCLSLLVLGAVLIVLPRSSPVHAEEALIAPAVPNVSLTEINPATLTNDLDLPVTIVGTQMLSITALSVGNVRLQALDWVSDGRIDAIVPWGIAPGVYTLTAEGADGPPAVLANAITITQGIDVWQTGELYGGDVHEVVANPLTPTTVYAAASEIGLFRSRDEGGSWTSISAPDAHGVAIDPVVPTTIYLGWFNQLSRSFDEGATWTDLADPPGNRPIAHPTTPGTLFAINAKGEAPGLWRSTDYGTTWITPTTGLWDAWVTDLVFHPTDPMTVVVGTSNGNLFVSSDGGTSWTYAARPVQNAQTLAFDPRGDHELWVSDCCFCTPQTYTSLGPAYTAFTKTLAARLTSIAFPDPVRWGAAYSHTVYAAGCWNDGYVSGDDGASWSSWGPTFRSWGKSIALDPDTPGTMYKASHQYGVLKSLDAGSTWSIANEGLTAMAPEQLATVPGLPQVVYATVDGWNGILRSDSGGSSWQFLEVSHADVGSAILVDPHMADRIFLGSHEAVFRSDDAGSSWTVTGTLPVPSECTVNVQTLGPSVFAADPTTPGALLAGANVLCNDFGLQMGAIYISANAGETWALADTGNPISRVVDLAYDVVTPGLVYATTEGSGLLRSADGGQHWLPMGAGVPALADVNSVTQGHQAPYRIFAQTRGPGGGDGIYGSDDHGETWTQLRPMLNSKQLLVVEEAPPALYAAASFGLLRSSDGISWARASGDLARVPVYALATVSTRDRAVLYAGTTGGLVTQATARAAVDESTLVTAGVHRQTLRIYPVMLPLVIRQ